MDLLCRVCLQTKSDDLDFISIFECEGNHDLIFNKIMKCAAVQITQDDLFPKEICKLCASNLDVAYKFKLQCEKSDEVFKEFLQPSNTEDFIELKIETELQSKPVEIKTELDNEDLAIHNDVVGDDIAIRKRGRPKKIKDKHFIQNDLILETKNLKRLCRLSGKRTISPMEKGVKVKLEDEYVYDSFDEDFIPDDIIPKVKKKRGRPKKMFWDDNGKISSTKPKLLLVCDQCGKSFKFLESLKGHQRRHTGEKPFMCSTCGKLFHVFNELKKHANTHSGVKPYSCQYCDRGFTDWGSRFKHERCHRGERPYKCDVCLKTFSYSYVLNRHKLTHTGDKPFSCELCKKNFTLKYHLTNHNRKYHKSTESAEKPAADIKIDSEHSAFEVDNNGLIIESAQNHNQTEVIREDEHYAESSNVEEAALEQSITEIADAGYSVVKVENFNSEQNRVNSPHKRPKIVALYKNLLTEPPK